MIIIRFIGGLGNQLFQYAFYKQLEVNYPQEEIKVDITEFKNYALHNGFELERVFNLTLNKANQKEIIKVKSGRSFFAKVKRKLVGYKSTHIFQDKFDYSHVGGRNLYLDGYWQHPKFWELTHDNLAKFLQFNIDLSIKSKEILNKIKTENSISIHIRRGDYLLPQNANIFTNCSLDYYQKSISYFEEKYPDISFYVFSDDINWVKDNLKVDSSVEFINHNTGNKSSEDLFLMSQCKHNIIANSSFSWWGAYLNKNPNNEVICPDRWWKDPNHNDEIYIPKNWKKIQV